MSTSSVNRVIRLRRRPGRVITEGDLELVIEPVPAVGENQALVRTAALSVEAASRIWMGHPRAFMPPVPLDGVMRGIGVGEVIESRRADMAVGDTVVGFLGWQEYCLADDTLLEAPLTVLPRPLPAPASAFVGVLGHTSITAYLGIDYLDPKPGQTLVVSAAGGSVGAVAGQLGKRRGARVVGIAGGQEKCRHVIERLGFDACVDRKDPRWAEMLDEATPEGIDLDFENVGGPIMDQVLSRITRGARIFLCGEVSQYGGSDAGHGLRNVDQIHMQRATMRGFIVTDHLDRWPEAVGHLASLWSGGDLVYDETVIDGLERAPRALADLLDGATLGKVVVRLHAAAGPAW